MFILHTDSFLYVIRQNYSLHMNLKLYISILSIKNLNFF